MGLTSDMAGPSRAWRGHDRGVGVANRRVRRVLAAIGAGILAVPLTAGVAQAAPPAPSGPVVVVSGLNNPRQLSLVSGIELLVAEAGKGGSFELPGGGPEGPVFIGTTGSISAVFFPQFVHNTSPHRIVTGLLSGAAKDGSAATGSDGVSATRLSGPIYIQQTWFPPNLLPNTLPKDQLGQLLRARPFGPAKPFADITAFEAKHDPDGKGFDSDPYAVLVVGDHLLVADAAGNDVLRVDRRGHVSLFHVFPNVTTGACANQSIPPVPSPATSASTRGGRARSRRPYPRSAPAGLPRSVLEEHHVRRPWRRSPGRAAPRHSTPRSRGSRRSSPRRARARDGAPASRSPASRRSASGPAASRRAPARCRYCRWSARAAPARARGPRRRPSTGRPDP